MRLGRNSIIFCFVDHTKRKHSNKATCVQMGGSLVTEITTALSVFCFHLHQTIASNALWMRVLSFCKENEKNKCICFLLQVFFFLSSCLLRAVLIILDYQNNCLSAYNCMKTKCCNPSCCADLVENITSLHQHCHWLPFMYGKWVRVRVSLFISMCTLTSSECIKCLTWWSTSTHWPGSFAACGPVFLSLSPPITLTVK